jgi:hypothetical protein
VKWLVGLAFAVGLLVAVAAIAQLRARAAPAPRAVTAPAPTGAPGALGPGGAATAGASPAAPPGAAPTATSDAGEARPGSAGERCPAPDEAPALPAPGEWAAPLTLVVAAGAAVEVDGAPAPPSLPPGPHVLAARGPGASPARLRVDVDPFTPVLVDARRAEGAMTLLVLGARCGGCRLDPEPLDTAWREGSPGSRSEVSHALAAGEVSRAARAYRAIPPAERGTPEPLRLLAAVYALGGELAPAQEVLARLPPDDALAQALRTHRAAAAAMPKRQEATAVARWNALTERYQRLSDAFDADAPAVVSALTARFNGLSGRFQRAQAQAGGALAVETTLDEAAATLAQFVLTLRAQRPGDCGWQRRVSAAL